MKLRCRLCELQQKTGLLAATCTHVSQAPLASLYHIAGFVPHLQNMMLAACLLRGEFVFPVADARNAYRSRKKCYYQPAGPLITAHHAHSLPPASSKHVPLPTLEASPSPTPPPSAHQPAHSSTGESSDTEVMITATGSGSGSGSEPASVSAAPPAAQQPYRYPPYAGAAPPYAYSGYPSQYYHGAAGSVPFPQQQPQHFHHDVCYPPSYLHHKTYATPFRRYMHPPPPAGPQYYTAGNPELYTAPPSNPQNSQVVTASSGSGATNYQPPPTGPPPPTLIESYAPPPPPGPAPVVEPYLPHYFASYTAGGPACYSHSPPTRNLAFIDPTTYQSCPCPMQSCPKNVHTGPLTGDGKRSNASSISKESVPLPPVALALPLEPASVAGPPSPARGSAGMPPPPSPAGATYQPTPIPKWDAKQENVDTVLECKPAEKRRKARVGKTMARNNIRNSLNASQANNTMLLMCHNPPQAGADVSNVKREVESPEEVAVCGKNERVTDVEKTMCDELAVKPVIELSSAEVQSNIDECTKRLNAEDVDRNFKSEDSTVDKTVPVRRKSVATEEQIGPSLASQGLDEKSVSDIQSPKSKTADRAGAGVKRKLSVDDEQSAIVDSADYKVQTKKQKTARPKAVNSYKNLIKKPKKCYKVNGNKKILNNNRTPEKKIMIYKTPKIMLGKNKKAFKRKQSAFREENAMKKLKSSKPLTASNLHNSKQNVKNGRDKPAVQVAFEMIENKEPSKKTAKKKTQVKMKTNKKLEPQVIDMFSNVDRTIEYVVEESVRTCEKSEDVLNVIKVPENVKADVKCQKVFRMGCGKLGTSRKKMNKISVISNILPLAVPKVPRRLSLQMPRWSNGWSWEGESFQGKVFLNSDEALVTRKCYPAMRHEEGDVISPRDCVLLKAGPRKIDLPFVAKVAALWENPEDGEMMMSLLWYYRPEHTEQGRRPADQPDEVFASRHKDTNSVACIEDKCYVLTFNEYCRYRKTVRRLEEGMDICGQVVPFPEGGQYYRLHRQPSAPLSTSPDLVFFCRRVYDFRQKRIVKNPS